MGAMAAAERIDELHRLADDQCECGAEVCAAHRAADEAAEALRVARDARLLEVGLEDRGDPAIAHIDARPIRDARDTTLARHVGGRMRITWPGRRLLARAARLARLVGVHLSGQLGDGSHGGQRSRLFTGG